MDRQTDYFYQDAGPSQPNASSYYNDGGMYPDSGNYEMDYENREYMDQAEYMDNSRHRDGLDNRVTPGDASHNNTTGSDKLPQSLNANIEVENSQPVPAEQPNADKTNKTPIDYRTQLEVHEYNLTVNSQLKQIIMKSAAFNHEVKDLKKRLNQSEERFQRKSNEVYEYKERYAQSLSNLQKEKEQRSSLQESCKQLQETTTNLLKQVEDIHSVWPNLQHYVQEQTLHNQNLKEDYDAVSKELSSCASKHRKELDYYKNLLETTNKNESIRTAKIAELSEDKETKETALSECNEQNSKLQEICRILEDKYQQVLSVNNECRDAILQYRSQIRELSQNFENADKLYKDLSQNHTDLEVKHNQQLTENAQLKDQNANFQNKNLELLLELDKEKEENYKSAALLKEEIKSMQIKLNQIVVDNQAQTEKDQTVIRDLANHLDLYKAECEQKVKEEKAFVESKNKELQQQLLKLTDHHKTIDYEKDQEILKKNNKILEYESLVNELQRNLNNVNKRLEDKSNENLELLSSSMQLKAAIKSLEEAKLHYQQQIQSKNKEIDMLRCSQRLKNEKTAYIAPANNSMGYSAPINTQYKETESDSSADAHTLQTYFDKNNRKRVRIIPQKQIKSQQAAKSQTPQNEAP